MPLDSYLGNAPQKLELIGTDYLGMNIQIHFHLLDEFQCNCFNLLYCNTVKV